MTAELEKAYQTVIEVRERVKSQRALIDGLHRHDHDTTDAEELLRRYETMLAEAEARLKLLSQKGAA